MMFSLKYHLVTARVCLAGSFSYSRLPWLASLPSFRRYHCIYQSSACSSRYFEASVVPVCVVCLQPRDAVPAHVLEQETINPSIRQGSERKRKSG